MMQLANQSRKMLTIGHGGAQSTTLYQTGQWVKVKDEALPKKIVTISWEESQPLFDEPLDHYIGEWTEPGFFYRLRGVDDFEYPATSEVPESLIVEVVSSELAQELDRDWVAALEQQTLLNQVKRCLKKNNGRLPTSSYTRV